MPLNNFTEELTADEIRMHQKLQSKLPDYLESIGRVLENSDCIVCPVCGMYAYLYSKGSQWMCHDCNSDGDILDYCVMSGLFSDKRTALNSLCRQYGIKRSELEMLPADKLMGMQFKEEPAIIEGLLCPGLTMIYGSPKVGKSWLVLQIAVAVSKGEDFWSRKTQQGKVVYLALEDTYRRLKSRLSAQTDTIDDNLQFVIDSESLGNGLEMQLHNLMKSHPDTKLIIIDTFQRIRSPESNQYSYADDYREVDILKQFAAQHEIAVILVHHKRKMKAHDPLDEVSGTNGLTGSADTLMILTRKKRTSRTGTLVVSGRDLPGEEYDMAFSNTSMCWELLRVKNDMSCGNEIIETVSIFIDEKKEWSGTATELLAELTALTPNISVKANRLSAVLIDAKNELFADYGIAITRGRTSSKKTIFLRLLENDGNDAGDRDDANDGGDDTAAVSLPEIA